MTGPRLFGAEVAARILAAPKPDPATDPARCSCRGVILGCPRCCRSGGADLNRMVTWPWLT